MVDIKWILRSWDHDCRTFNGCDWCNRVEELGDDEIQKIIINAIMKDSGVMEDRNDDSAKHEVKLDDWTDEDEQSWLRSKS